MFRNRLMRRLAPALLVLLAFTSCSDQMPVGPAAEIVSPQADYAADGYTVITERIPADLLPGVSLSSLIGIDGGSVSIAGHVLEVPAGAVTVPTLFTLTVPLNGNVEVELTATVNTLLGVVDVGEKGFNKPVTLRLTYARASNVSDPADLFLAYMPNGDHSKHEKLPSTVDEGKKQVTASLWHFSKYCMATD